MNGNRVSKIVSAGADRWRNRPVVAGGADPGRSERNHPGRSGNHLRPAGVTAPGYDCNSA